MYIIVGAVKIQLDRVSKENGIPVDEVVVKFPIDSPDEVNVFIDVHVHFSL